MVGKKRKSIIETLSSSNPWVCVFMCVRARDGGRGLDPFLTPSHIS